MCPTALIWRESVDDFLVETVDRSLDKLANCGVDDLVVAGVVGRLKEAADAVSKRQ
jgi:hypothetical protein